MGSYSDSTSDLDEELPVFDFLQPGRGRASRSHAGKPDSECSDAKATSKGNAGAADVLMISSDSDDCAPYVPLAQRLKQRQGNAISASSAVGNGEDAERCSPSDLASARLLPQNGSAESERPLGLHQVRTVSRGVSSGDTSPARRKPAKRTEEIQASREEALRRRQAREGQQKGKEALKEEQERQKAERKALAEAAKALRPEECIKHMVVAVDPGL